jgi:hypothetical protein
MWDAGMGRRGDVKITAEKFYNLPRQLTISD